MNINQYCEHLKNNVVFVLDDGDYDECLWNDYYIPQYKLCAELVEKLIILYCENMAYQFHSYEIIETKDQYQDKIDIKIHCVKYNTLSYIKVYLVPTLLDFCKDDKELV